MRQVLHVPRSHPRFALYFASFCLYSSHLFLLSLFLSRLSLGETFIGSSLCRRSLQHRRQQREAEASAV